MKPLVDQNSSDRIVTLDIIRGFALLGILIMNIPGFSISQLYEETIVKFEGAHTLNYYVWLFNYIFLNGKMRLLFSMIFGAGIILFTSKNEHNNLNLADAYFRRMLWLLVFALFTSYILIASTEILYEYALCGILLFVFRHAKVRWLFIIATLSLTIISIKGGIGFVRAKEQLEIAKKAKIDLLQGKKISEEQQNAITFLENALNPNIKLLESKRQADIEAGRSGYKKIFLKNAIEYNEIFSVGFYSSFWETFGSLALGMGLFKTGFFSGKFKRRTYLWISLIGLGLGLPFAYYLAQVTTKAQIETTTAFFETRWFSVFHLEQIPRVLCGLGYAGFLIFIYQMGWVKKITYVFTCLGKMAFTNYLLQNIFCSIFFFGFGFGMFGKFQYYQLYYIVFAIWIIQIVFSIIWLRFYKIGPFEWLWRRLTYGKKFSV